MNIFDIINVPFGALINFFYNLGHNYAFALLLFAIVVKIVLLPLGIQQQKSQIKMAKIRPKEQAIRKKYAGRKDTVTQQKMQSEIMDMYKAENHSPMGGCLPAIIQIAILWPLYSIIRQPLTYIARLAPDMIKTIQQYIIDNKDAYVGIVKNLANMTNPASIQQIDIVDIFRHADLFDTIKHAVNIPDTFQNIDFGFFGQNLTSSPSAVGFISVLMLIPLINLVTQFLQMRIQRIINSKTALKDVTNNGSMKAMEYIMPLFMVYISYTMYAAIGLYWIYQSILGIAQILVLTKLYPIPQASEEEYRLAEIQYGVASPKKKKKKPVDENPDGSELIETELLDSPKDKSEIEKGNENGENGENEENKDTGEDKKYISKTIPQGVNPQIKNNYQKTGKKYTVKRRNKDK